MGWKIFFSFIFILFAIFLLIFYWFIPFNTTEFGVKDRNSNFSLNNLGPQDMQFYKNMRFPNPEISYRVDDCTLQKENDMERAFEIISDVTVLSFYPINYNEEIYVTCDSKNKVRGEMFIAGEGGPTNITKTENFNVILHGRILLIKESKCERPNIAIHELLHVLGFDHSMNPNNIMYNISKCDQTIGYDMLELINRLYSFPTYADLSFDNVSAVMHGKYLDANISIRNNGLKDSGKAKLMIFIEEKLIKEIDLGPIEIGYGRTISLKNVWVPRINVDELEFFIDSSFNELEKNNNKIILKIKS